MALTPQAPAFLEQAEEILARAARLEDPESFANQAIQHLYLGCFQDLAPTDLASVLRADRRAAPAIEIEPEVADFETLAGAMLKGRIDLALTYDLGLDGGFERRVLARVSPHAFLAEEDPLAKAASLSLADLAERPLILSDEGLSIHHMLSLFRSQGHRLRIAYNRVRSLETMRSLAANGEGAGLSYSVPPSRFAYDATPLATRAISDPAAREPIILARYGSMTPSPTLLAIAESIKTAGLFAGAI